jgi:acyl-ACP thioesterase
MSSRGKHVGDNARDMTFLLPRPAPVFRADPARGRVFTSARMVQSTEVTPAGRLRLDALARYLQQAAEDDVGDAGWDGSYLWLLRRVALAIRGFPAHRERISLRTYCSATGPRWAERTTVVAGPEGELIQSTAIWVAVSAADGRPVTLGEEFHRVYGPSTEGRQVSARLSHPGLPGSAGGRPWPLRAVDFDTAGHVNNAVHWAALEDELPGLDWLPGHAELEYHRPILPGAEPELVTSREPGELRAWLRQGPQRLASAWLTAAARP